MTTEPTIEWKDKEGVTFKVGDIVTGYSPGVHRIAEIQRRFWTKDEERYNYGKAGEEYSALVVLDTVLNGKWKPMKRRSQCDISFCKHFSAEDIRKKMQEDIKTYETAIKILS